MLDSVIVEIRGKYFFLNFINSSSIHNFYLIIHFSFNPTSLRMLNFVLNLLFKYDNLSMHNIE